MTLEGLVRHYGLVALFLGAGLEGEAVVVAGGLLAHQGLFSLTGACVAASVGSFLADQIWFAVGRRSRDHRWVRRVRGKRTFARALGWLERYPRSFIFLFRFIYGMRTVSPVAIGTSQVPARLFFPINAIAAVMWGTIFSIVGYLFGHGFEAFAGRLRPRGHHLWWIVGGLVAAGVALGAVHWWRTRER
ncbi:DedA family protein [Sphingomonas bacterium]|uniref:DedA family protein n=1 Tax=Sphingomonas bacterium TaxID=1895847 RepID=UPI001576147E|nr:DedA family protein [Sphingomonas bacterium]